MKPHKPVELDSALFEQALANRAMTSSPRLARASDLQQLSRITVGVEDLAEAQALASASLALLRYDIVAACPRSLPALIHLCKTADVDIISLDLNHQMHFTVDQKLIAAARKRGVVFEVCYSHLMHSKCPSLLTDHSMFQFLNYI
jgi:RNase P/RNase MRP subunit p30